jgi:hypothetical protein
MRPIFAASESLVGKEDPMQTVAAPKYSVDRYFTDIIREIESQMAPVIAESLSRRRFIKLTGFAGAGLVLAYSLGGASKRSSSAIGGISPKWPRSASMPTRSSSFTK